MNEKVKGANSKKAHDNSRDAIVDIESHVTKLVFVIAEVQDRVDDAMSTIEELKLGEL